ncbi:hypothetical protein [Ferruginibacter albus]|uniref:hypothetical protein n=1 Tax=Ferruginibacter albus TaxID=2875540 RepID=UPI001CC7D98C|nr:hypothetical protein [Ferruginibacter albus]UAY52438.1 hypothetical protein K9M53_01800 [Ferruginibacter albus]
MTPRTFFTIVIKILGIYIVLESLSVIAQFISTFFYYKNDGDRSWQEMAYSSFVICLVIGVYLLVLRVLVFKTDWVIDKLKLDKNFPEEKIEINLHRSTVLSIAVIVIGGLIFIDALPLFCKQVFIYFQQRSLFRENFVQQPTNGWIIFYGAKAFVGACIVIYQRTIVNFIEFKRKKI